MRGSRKSYQRGSIADDFFFIIFRPFFRFLFFLVDEGRREDPNNAKAGDHRHTNTPFKLCFAGGPMMEKWHFAGG